MEYIVSYLTADFPHRDKFVGFFMALFGAQTVANGRNKNRDMAWFHALFLSACVGYGGSIFTPWMFGRPISLFFNDFNAASIFVAFYLMHYTPMVHAFNSFPGRLSITMLSTLFRATGVKSFCTIAFEASKGTPSQLGYDIMIIGPILFPTLLGNMGALFLNGLDLLKNGIPFAFQQTLFNATFYHFFVHDKDGIIGVTLRDLINTVPAIKFGLSDDKFALLVVSTIMHINAIMKMPEFAGSKFTLFRPIGYILKTIFFMNSYYGIQISNNETKVSKEKKVKTN